MIGLISGATVMASAIAGLYFLRFWKSSRDPFFLYFAVAFWIQSAQWLHAGLSRAPDDYSPLYYLARLAAYVLIVYAIVRKNYPRKSRDS